MCNMWCQTSRHVYASVVQVCCMSIGTYSVLLCDCDDLELSLRLSFSFITCADAAGVAVVSEVGWGCLFPQHPVEADAG